MRDGRVSGNVDLGIEVGKHVQTEISLAFNEFKHSIREQINSLFSSPILTYLKKLHDFSFHTFSF